MRNRRLLSIALASGWMTAAAALAVPQADPTYTFCETEGNDTCANAQVLDASVAVGMSGSESVRDCFYITGKLQEDCVWNIEPKCALRVFDKPAPCRTSTGQVIPGSFYEPIIRSSNGTDLTNVIPLSDRTIRLGVAALMDAFDGTINGLSGNGPHGEMGEVTVKVFYNGGDGQPRGSLPDQEYVFSFGGRGSTRAVDAGPVERGVEEVHHAELAMGTDALRVAFVIPNGVGSVTIQCCTNTGTTPLCYDTDFYKIENLIPGKFYGIEVVGGLSPRTMTDFQIDCFPTNTKLGWFDKNCNLLAMDDNRGHSFNVERGAYGGLGTFLYSKLFATAESDGTLRIGVTGGGFDIVVPVIKIDPGRIPPSGAGGSGDPANDTLTSSFTVPDNVISRGFYVRNLVVAGLEGFVHTYAGDLIVKLRHEDTGTTVRLFDRLGKSAALPMGYPCNFFGLYNFSDNPVGPIVPGNLAATAAPLTTNQVIPNGLYRPLDPLSAFDNESIVGTWTLSITDASNSTTLAVGNIGAIASWALIADIGRAGDCDFNGLEDEIQQQYFDLLRNIRIIDGLNYTYTQGASTKDDSVDNVNRYPRPLWDPPSPQNPQGFDLKRRFGGGPEAFYAHGVCGGYCIKVQLAEHVDSRPSFPPASVMSGARADMNQDGAVNSADLALLLSYWGVVQ